MKLSMMINYAGGFKEAVQRVVDLEKAGLDQVWIAEAYSYDAISQVGYLAAKTERVEIGTGIVNVYSRTAALMAMTAAGCDYISDGRFILGLGASGPQVIEGFHGVPYEKPMQRIKEYIEACRMIWKREEKFDYQGITFQAPLPEGQGTGLGKPLKLINHPLRSDIPIWWASLKGMSVEATAEIADGWLPMGFMPGAMEEYRPWLEEGFRRAGDGKSLKNFSVVASVHVQVDDDVKGALAKLKPEVALYVGGMGHETKNFHNDIMVRRGFGDAARRIQELYLAKRKDEAIAAVPDEWVDMKSLVGPPARIRERYRAWEDCGADTISVRSRQPEAIEVMAQAARLN